jgi:hypothetical protein
MPGPDRCIVGKRVAAFVIVGASLLATAQPARAVDGPDAGTLTFVLENDTFARNDSDYTSGIALSWIPANTKAPEWAVSAARWLPWFPEEGRLRHGYAVGQSIFNPGDWSLATPPLDDRPYAGWLYGTIGLGIEKDRQLDQVALTVGVVGPASLAEPAQNFIHQIQGLDEPQGWDTQLANELGVVLMYERSWRSATKTMRGGFKADVAPSVGAALGNVYTYANAGLIVRFGSELPNDYGPVRIQPGIPGSGVFTPTERFTWYLFAGVEGRAMARNIFLDGNTFEDSRSVEKEPLVGDFQVGFAMSWRKARLSYSYVLRSREFEAQSGNTRFGALSISVPF